MVFQSETVRLTLPFDETKWRALTNYQGSFVTLFDREGAPEPGGTSSLAVMLYPKNELPMRQIYLNTVLELRQMLTDFAVTPLHIGEDACEFEYEGNVQNLRMRFCQRIFRDELICSATGGCAAAIAAEQLPRLKELAVQIRISERSVSS